MMEERIPEDCIEICAQRTMMYKMNNVNTSPRLPPRLLRIYSLVGATYMLNVHSSTFASKTQTGNQMDV